MSIEKAKDKELLEELNRRGYFSFKPDIREGAQFNLPEPTGHFKIGVVSDTHLGSVYQQITYLNDFYQMCKEEGVSIIIHAGDVCEGNGKLYRGQLYEMFLHGANQQLQYLIKNYPKVKGITTYMIGGNHCYSFFSDSGYDILDAFAKQRKDIQYLGMYSATLKIEKVKFLIMHGSSGNAYAVSYRLQKIIEQLSPEGKPNILLLGHYHKPCHIEAYRNVEGFQLKCFQSQTPFLRGKGLFPVIGGIILDITHDKKGLNKIRSLSKVYYTPIEHDF